MMNESVVLAALAAGIGIGRQLRHQAVVELAPAETAVETI